MLTIFTPTSDHELEDYFSFRYRHLREPWGFPPGSEKDEYDSVAEHRVLLNGSGDIIACGRVHLNSSEEAQIRHIAVADNYRRKGVGELILQTLEKVAREQGAIRAVTNSRESSIDFFSACGYQIEKVAPTELGKLKRKQMVKALIDHDALILHPKWCAELQQTWQEQIPISEHMGIKIYQYTESTFETRASLNKNVNLHGTMFAGSIFSQATLTGWGMIFLQLKQKQLRGEIVLGDADIHYHKPITMTPRALCNRESIQANFDLLLQGKKCPIDLKVELLDGDNAVAKFDAKFWVLPAKV